MAKRIKLQMNDIVSIEREFHEMISNGVFPDGKISFQKTLGIVNERIEVRFSAMAYFKMKYLVYSSEKEIGWHGSVSRDGNTFYVSDIAVYPQEVTGVTVTTDQQKYSEWLYSLDDDAFNSIRLQGHSHVNMGTSPSGVDESLYERILAQLGSEDFYIFLIMNKKSEIYARVYDIKNNVQYDSSDIDFNVIDDGYNVKEFMDEIDKNVVTKVTTYTPKTTYQSSASTKKETQNDHKKKEETVRENLGWYNNYYEKEEVDLGDPFYTWGW